MRWVLLVSSLLFVLFATKSPASDSEDTIRMAYAMREAVRDPSGSQVESLLKAGFPPNHPIACGTFDALDAAVGDQAVWRQHAVVVKWLLPSMASRSVSSTETVRRR